VLGFLGLRQTLKVDGRGVGVNGRQREDGSTAAALPVENASDGNTLGPAEIEGEAVDRLIGWCMTYLINFTGHPAATVPAGLAENGMPVGMQIVGRRYADADVIAASAEFERMRPWMDTYRRAAAVLDAAASP